MERPWFEALPKCKQTSVGQFISRNGVNFYTPEDNLAFYFQHEDDCSLYGVFDAENGSKAAHLIMQRFAAELLFQPFNSNTTIESIQQMLSNAFSNAEKFYIESCDGLIAERTSLQYQLQTNSQNESAMSLILARLRCIDKELSSGCSCCSVIIKNNILFASNIGNTRLLLLKTNEDNVLTVVQLSVDHDLNNTDELMRLKGINMDLQNNPHKDSMFGVSSTNRCLGNLLIKVLFRAFDKNLLSPPVIAQPHFIQPTHLQTHFKYLVIVSSTVIKRLERLFQCDSDLSNRHLAQIIIQHIRHENNFQQVSQNVLNEIESKFTEYCQKENIQTKNDVHMTLLIRKFEEEERKVEKVSFNPIVESKSASTLVTSPLTHQDHTPTDTQVSESSERSRESSSNITKESAKKLDRIAAYVKFDQFYQLIETAKQNNTLHPSLQTTT